MPRILVIDDMPLFREALAATLRSAGYETDWAANGDEALRKARTTLPDLVILKAKMEQADGLEIARKFKGDAQLGKVAIALLSQAADKETVLEAARLGVRDFLLKSRVSLPEFLERIQKSIQRTAEENKSPAANQPLSAAPAPVAPKKPPAPQATSTRAAAPPAAPSGAPLDLPQLMTREQCLARLEKAHAAKPMSGVVTQVLALAGSPSAEMSELAAMICRDPAFSTRVLRAANSAAFAGARKIVTTIPDAVRNVGISALRNIAAAISVAQAVPSGAADGFHHMRGWQHSFAAALICQHLAELSQGGDGGAAYLVGLCHDLGQILFRTEFGREYSEVLLRQAECGRPLEVVERHMLGITQLDLAKVILRKLELPEGISKPIEEFHTTQAHHNREPTLRLARIMRIAEPYANGLLMAALPTSEVGPIMKAECKQLLDRENPARPNAVEMRNQILTLTPLLARLPEAEEAKLSQPMMEKSARRVLLVRDAFMSAFDPMEAALSSLAELTVADKFPAALSPDEFDAVVVVSKQKQALKNAAAPIMRLSMEEARKKDIEGNVTECGASVSLEKLARFVTPPAEELRQVA